MKELEGQLAGLDEEMRDAATKAVRGYEDELKLAGEQVKSLERAIDEQSKATASTDADLVQLQALELDAKTKRDQLESYMQKYREAIARDSTDSEPPNARIIETAIEPRTPVFPKKTPTLILGTLAGFVLSFAAVVSQAILAEDANLRAARTARRSAMGDEADEEIAPPRRRPITGARAVRDPDPQETEALDGASLEDIVDRLADYAPRRRLTLLVTGEAAPGALTIALTAARRLSRMGRTVLVDLGATQPWLSDVVDRDADEDGPFTGLSDLVDGRATFEQALHRDLSSRVDILPVGAEPIYRGEFGPVLEALIESYNHVVVHASDWRSSSARDEIPSFSAILLCARRARLAALRESVAREVGNPAIAIEGLALEKT